MTTITVERHIPDEHVDRFHRLYAAAFGPVRARAAARHMLTAAEFAEEMADKRIDKYVAWNDGRSVGKMWDRVARRGVAQADVLDTQTYYAASFTEVAETGSVE